MSSKIPAIPALEGAKLPTEIYRFIAPIKETIEIREGRRGTSDSTTLTIGDFETYFASYWATYILTLGAETINDHTGSYTILLADLNEFHRFTGAATVTLPESSSTYVGYWVDIRKRTTGNVVVECAGSDVIVEAGTTSLQNTNSTENWASIRLIIEESGTWGIVNQLGSWAPP